MAKTKVLICPYCGESQPAADRCRACRGLLDPLSRQATHNAMGPWFLRDPQRPHQPGCSYETLVRLIDRGQVNKNTIIRGPTTRQFWNAAKRVAGISHLLGYCHNCDAAVEPTDHGCHACGVPFGAYLIRNHLGLPEIEPLPGDPEGGGQGGPAGADGSAIPPLSPAWSGIGMSGISSFAPDAELLAGSSGQGASAVTAGAGAGENGPSGSSTGGDDFVSTRRPISSVSNLPERYATPVAASYSMPTPQPMGQDWAMSPATRAMQRKLARQQRMIRVMGIGLIAIAVVAVAVSITSILTLTGVTGQGRDAGSPSQSQDAPEQPAEGVTSSDIEGIPSSPLAPFTEQAPLEEAGEMIEGTGDSGAQRAMGEALADQPGEPDLFATLLGQAEELIERASKTERSSADRLTDYRAALALLERIAADAPPGQRPADLSRRIERVRQAIDQIEVDSFFNR